ncbi:SMR2 protein-like [Rattus norvegicus]|uniref:SMR2 protein-like n=1 Tax=Rattus norvegicus TaxID=10116 RepID=UPI0002687B69|nr:SMR2 protein-like [Rattus norvegicus]|eukprot:XP_002729461.2 PREDICTED: SMR2 protein-like [Rattus norvegicus]
MLVVLLTAELLALSSAQRRDQEINNAETSDVQQHPDSVQQTQDSDSDLPSVDVNSGNVQEHESTPAANEAPSANPGNEQEQKQQQSLLVENQEPFDTEKNPEQKPSPPKTLHYKRNTKPQIYCYALGIRPLKPSLLTPIPFLPWA